MAKLPADSYEDQRGVVVGSVVFCIMFPTTLVGLRIYTRTKVIELFGVDDVLAIAGLLALIGCGTAIAAMTEHGLGRHISTLDKAEIPEYLHTFFVSIVFYNIALLCIKLSFLFQYYRIMAVPKMRRIYAVAIVVVGAWAVSQLLIATFTCIPVEGFWDKTIKAYCIPNQPQWYVNAAGNIATDVAVFALPLPIFWHLSLPRKQKLLLMGIFSLGFFTVAVSIVRTKYLSIQQDFTWTNVEASLWSLGEISSAVTCACLPTLRPLMTKLFPRMMARVNYSLHSDTRGTRDTRGTFPTSAYPPAIVKPDVEMATTESAVSSARSSHAKEDKSATHVSPYSNQHQTASTESIFGLASVREDAITPVKSNFSPTSPRPTWSPSSSKGSQGRRDIRRNGSVI
ncbi:hypothetical protein CGMCC3_g10232 [Colletotrichum fructicola]|uniref:Integral membrane protein n=1 Tax=Colletotrichum fructicola (strain Nara gc5) TaxID=1213859 RepID=L2FD11_COLFN|nr:uncharacterized protein CGMCC3_g10232 [Colletotrichum fructicola]KAF4476963.1 Satratoxin biosynthesis SC1 cluster protein 4 [Colletotrichum fructicola Nara gc5]KAE9573752.1 hypothetical protein CGMCC3_g10232 [Colletotrichum fructicola]KAF4419287.1 Satratoxin biosynthesis SC1 cluster protein 4 [Colletotrichum fructicola]KAF4884760.1 Satratoxin biosynthesis SC1 cluster protein 4 [Colletotrichum fructicola]KAF4926717.1 Satratoxin biosynthesis SC1 cluster protein 4 [Colletotrichum fructicola]